MAYCCICMAYDLLKRENCPFSIVRMPYRCSNMPSTIYYSSIGAEILRICKASTNKNDCINSAKLLITRMICQGAEKVRLRNTLRKFYGRHMEIFQKVSENSIDFVNLLITWFISDLSLFYFSVLNFEYIFFLLFIIISVN